jgi:hypothetical protein
MAVGLTSKTAANFSDLENRLKLAVKFLFTPVLMNIVNVASNLIVGDALKCIHSYK